MIIGLPVDRMLCEGRVSLLPETIIRLKRKFSPGICLDFMAESGLGARIGLTDEDWRIGATVITGTREDARRRRLYDVSDLILKVKQPLADEVEYYHKGQGASCFHHVAANRDVAAKLLEKKVLILPWENHRPTLSAMSKAAGLRIPKILDRFSAEVWRRDWRKENIFVLGARGMVGRHAVHALFSGGVSLDRIFASDIVDGDFSPSDTPTSLSYRTFSSGNNDELFAVMQVCRIVILAALSSRGAPQIITRAHLGILPHDSLVIQVAIDEGGNIYDPFFGKITYWNKPFYHAYVGPKRIYLCNLPDIPGCIDPAESTRELIKANFEYLCEIIRAWPDVPEKYLFRGF